MKVCGAEQIFIFCLIEAFDAFFFSINGLIALLISL